MIHDPHRATLCGTLKVSHPAYALLSPDAQRQRVLMWGRSDRIACPVRRRAAGCRFWSRRSPTAARASPTTTRNTARGETAGPSRSTKALLASSATGASTHRTTLTLSLDMQKAGAAVKAAGGGLKGAARVLRDDMAALEYVLRAAESEGRSTGWGRASRPDDPRRLRPGPGRPVPADAPGANLSHAGPLGWMRCGIDSTTTRAGRECCGSRSGRGSRCPPTSCTA